MGAQGIRLGTFLELEVRKLRQQDHMVELNTLKRWSKIKQADAHISQNKPTEEIEYDEEPQEEAKVVRDGAFLDFKLHGPKIDDDMLNFIRVVVERSKHKTKTHLHMGLRCKLKNCNDREFIEFPENL